MSSDTPDWSAWVFCSACRSTDFPENLDELYRFQHHLSCRLLGPSVQLAPAIEERWGKAAIAAILPEFEIFQKKMKIEKAPSIVIRNFEDSLFEDFNSMRQNQIRRWGFEPGADMACLQCLEELKVTKIHKLTDASAPKDFGNTNKRHRDRARKFVASHQALHGLDAGTLGFCISRSFWLGLGKPRDIPHVRVPLSSLPVSDSSESFFEAVKMYLFKVTVDPLMPEQAPGDYLF